MDWLKFMFFIGTFVTSYGITENSKQFGDHANSPLPTSTKARNKRFVQFSRTGPGQWEANVNLPPLVKYWLNKPQYAPHVRDIKEQLHNGIRIGRKEIKGYGNDKSWTIKIGPIGSRITEVPTITKRERYSKVITDDDDKSIEEIDGDYETTSEEDFKPCKYGSFENPFPVPHIEKRGRRISDIKCEKYMWHLKYRILDAEENKKQCNRLRRITQIFGGVQSPDGGFPHMGAVGWIKNNNKISFKCGTSLISSRFSITAGHCKSLPSQYLSPNFGRIRDRSPRIVRFGSVEILDVNDNTAIDMIIDKFIVPSEFSAKPHLKYNDIGLIRFTKKVEFSKYVRPACLWSGSLDRYSSGFITGWGVTGDEMTSQSSQLQYAEVDFINKDVCRRNLEPRRNRNWRQGLMDYQFCAGKLTGGVDTCVGDSGGPIQLRKSLPMDSRASMYHVVGITNFGINCGEPNLPGVYTNVKHFLGWIEKIVWKG